MKSTSFWNERAWASRDRTIGPCFLAMLALLACATPVVRAQSPAPLTVPNLQLQQNGSVLSSVTLPDGSFIVGGTFTSFNSAHRSNIAKFQADGTLDPSWAPT